MTVSPRLRFEIFRRDDHACRYCGGRAPDVALTVDHVVPTTLGGSDEPGNLVTACADCNAGKSATAPDQNIVDDVAADALRWASALREATNSRAARRQEIEKFQAAFEISWNAWTYESSDYDDDGKRIAVRATFDLPPDWRNTMERFYSLNVDPAFLEFAIDIAMRADTRRRRSSEFKYMCGVVYRELERRSEMAREILRQMDATT